MALMRQRTLIRERSDRLRMLHDAVDNKTDLSLYQWAQLFAFTTEFAPDLIIDLGRGRGNSTCIFTEAANLLGNGCRVVSLCISPDWEALTRPKIVPMVDGAWFDPLLARIQDIRFCDFADIVGDSRRVLAFWDAHGFDIAEHVLGRLLPLVADKPHVVLMHDISDLRYMHASSRTYGDKPLWKGNNWDGPRLKIGNLDSAVEQAVAILDFTTRNGLTLFSGDHSLHRFFDADRDAREALLGSIGPDFFNTQAHWRWFTLNEGRGPYTFPAISEPSATGGEIGQGEEQLSNAEVLDRIRNIKQQLKKKYIVDRGR